MRTRIAAGLTVLTAAAIVLAGGSVPHAAAQDKSKITPPAHLYGHDLRVRKGGDPNFGPDTPRIGVEFFRDDATKSIVAVSDTGAIAVAKAPVGALGTDKTCKWLTAHDLSCRKAGEAEFTQKTRKFGVELFQDRSSNSLLYVSETGSVALAPVPGGLVTDKGPKWHHALEPKVRAPEQDAFDSAKKVGLEVFKDENTNGLILKVRGADEPNFTDKTKRVPVEVFEDPNAGAVFYITDAGFVATAPSAGKVAADARGVTWRSAMALKARKAGEKEFEKAKKFGIEVFEDNRTGNLIFISETGSVADTACSGLRLGTCDLTTCDSKGVSPPRRRAPLAPAVLFEPQPRLHALADLRQPGKGRLADELGPIVRRHREHQLEVLPVAERVLERRPTGRAAQLAPSLGNRDGVGEQHRPTPALFADVVEVGGEPVADVAHRLEAYRLMKAQRLRDTRGEVDMVPEDAAPPRAGHEQPGARPRAGPAHRAARGRLTECRHRNY